MELDFVTLDNKEYLIIDEIRHNDINYLYLVNNKNSKDFVIRKEKGDLLVGLDNEEEFNDVMQSFINKNVEEIR
ncbi:MAG: hypothetical protein IKG58_01460 [Bacilli bacterium]|nr:hypothetical protein [Bacilli bacterium]